MLRRSVSFVDVVTHAFRHPVLLLLLLFTTLASIRYDNGINMAEINDNYYVCMLEAMLMFAPWTIIAGTDKMPHKRCYNRVVRERIVRFCRRNDLYFDLVMRV